MARFIVGCAVLQTVILTGGCIGVRISVNVIHIVFGSECEFLTAPKSSGRSEDGGSLFLLGYKKVVLVEAFVDTLPNQNLPKNTTAQQIAGRQHRR